MKILCINSKPNLSFFTTRGLTIDITYDTCTQIFSTIKSGTSTNTDGSSVTLYSPDVRQYLENTYKDKKYDVIFFGWKPEDYGSEFASTGGQTFGTKLSNGAWFATVRQDGGNYEPHEMMHLIGKILYNDLNKPAPLDQMDATTVNGKTYFYYRNNEPENPDSNFGITWNYYKKYLPELNNLNMPTYKYFKPSEIVNLVPSFVSVLDTARGISNTPYQIASGYRTLQQNKEAGGVSNSSHTKGLAVDLQCTDNAKRTKILFGLLTCGTPLFIEIAGRHIHVDMDSSIHPMGHTIWGNDAT